MISRGSMPLATSEERLGTVIAGKYRIDAILGKGGMATVFAGEHEWTERRVAVKLLDPQLARDPEYVQRFLREAKAAATLEHPNVVEVIDMGRDEDDTVYLVLELVTGRSLADLLELQGRLTVRRSLQIVLPLLDALAAAHARGIVHRDLKPDNVFVGELDGRPDPKLLDFGIAKFLDPQQSSLTSSGAIVGTPYYMSPEQARGRSDVGPASDIWSMGVVLFECLTGHVPFEGPTPTAVILAILNAEPPVQLLSECEVPPTFIQVLRRAMSPDLAHRYPDARSFADALCSAAREHGVEVGDIRRPGRPSGALPRASDPVDAAAIQLADVRTESGRFRAPPATGGAAATRTTTGGGRVASSHGGLGAAFGLLGLLLVLALLGGIVYYLVPHREHEVTEEDYVGAPVTPAGPTPAVDRSAP